MRPLLDIHDPNYQAVFFRRTTKALEKAGSLWPEGKSLWKPFKARVREQKFQHVFKNGATISMDHLEHEKDAEGNHQGTQYSFVGFDELTHFLQSQFLYLIGRLRSAAEGNSSCMATCNPDPDSWVFKWVEWYLDEDGYPDPDKCGVVRYFVVVNDEPVFADTPEELAEEYPHICYQENPLTGEEIYVPPMSFAFVGGTIFDNPALIAANPKYLSALKAQSEVNRARLLDGNWLARPEGSGLWKRQWVRGDNGEKVKQYKDIPDGCVEFRGWDKGYSEPSDVTRYPDFTASTKILKDPDGEYWLIGDHHPECYDDSEKDKNDSSKVYGRFRKLAGARDTLILKQALYDGKDCSVVLTKDTGGQGTDHTYTMARLVEAGIKVVEDKSPKNTPGKKVKDFQPFANACSIGLVHVVEESFNKNTLESFYKELEAFSGEKSTGTRKDDRVDSTAITFNAAAAKKVFRFAPRNQTQSATLAKDVLDAGNDISLSDLENPEINFNQ